jgi:hypothetical protein
MHKTFITAALATATLSATALGGAPTQAAQPRFDTSLATPGDGQLIASADRCFPGERSFDCRNRWTYERRHHSHYVWRNGRYEDDSGAAIAGGILGFALGAAIAGSQDDYDYYNSHRNDRGWRHRCQESARGFDWHTGTYLGDDGYRHYCRM